MNEKQSSFNSGLVVDGTAATAAAAAVNTGERDEEECGFNQAIDDDDDDHDEVQEFISNTEESISRGVVEHADEGNSGGSDGTGGWKSYPDDDYSCPRGINAVKIDGDIPSHDSQSTTTITTTQRISRLYHSNTNDGVVVLPTMQRDSSSPSSSSLHIDNSSIRSTTSLQSSSTAAGVGFTGVSSSNVGSSSNETISRVMQLRLPSKDEIQSIIDASNVPRSVNGKTLLISIDEGGFMDGGGETNRMNTSWASGV